MRVHFHAMNNACGMATTCDEGDLHLPPCWAPESGAEWGEPAAHFSSDVTQSESGRTLTQTQVVVSKLQQDGRAKFSHLEGGEAVWLSVIRLNGSSGFPRCWRCESDCERFNPADEVRVRLSSAVCVCVCWQGGWLGTVPCWLGSCSDTESDATGENRQLIYTWTPPRRTRSPNIVTTPSTHVPVCIRELLFVQTCYSSVY